MPWFSGELREYPRCRKVMPSLNSSTAHYTLRSCLDEGPLAVVKGVDNDNEEMWRRLNEKHGDPAKITDVIINSIQRVKAIKEEEEKRFVDIIIIEKRLPLSVLFKRATIYVFISMDINSRPKYFARTSLEFSS